MRWPGQSKVVKYAGLPIREDDCSYVWNIPVPMRCLWVQETEDCKVDSILPYPTLLFCTFGSESSIFFTLGLILIILWLFYLFLILGITADNFFCPSLSTIATVLRLSENIAGVTILAFGNGSPDIFTALVSNEDERLMMFTELIGAGVFVTGIIAGSVIIFAPCILVPKYFIRDASFYVMAVSWICFIIWDDVVHLWEALASVLSHEPYKGTYDNPMKVLLKSPTERLPMLQDAEVMRIFSENRQEDPIWYIPKRSRAYVLQAKLDVAIERELDREMMLRGETRRPEASVSTESRRPKGLIHEFFYDANPVDGHEWREASCLAKMLLLLRAPLMLILQLLVPVVNETAEKRGWSKLLNCLQIAITPTIALFVLELGDMKFGSFPLVAICFCCTSAIALLIFGFTSTEIIPKFHNALAFVGFLTAMLVVYLVAQEVMAVLACIGFASGISDAMLGITLLAWGNSIGDLISNVAIARKGFPRMGFSACFGGPMFNTLLGLGLTYGISAAGSDNFRIRVRTSDMAPGCLAFLLVSLLGSLMYLNVTAFVARRSYGYLLYSIYGVFLLIHGLSEAHFMHPLGVDHRPDDVL